MDLPPADRKALVMGMALHEKGRKLMQDNKWKPAVELLLQADNSFNHWSALYLLRQHKYTVHAYTPL